MFRITLYYKLFHAAHCTVQLRLPAKLSRSSLTFVTPEAAEGKPVHLWTGLCTFGGCSSDVAASSPNLGQKCDNENEG